jgi:hypothetical protein
MLEDGGFINDNPPLKLEIIEVPGKSPHLRHNAGYFRTYFGFLNPFS